MSLYRYGLNLMDWIEKWVNDGSATHFDFFCYGGKTGFERFRTTEEVRRWLEENKDSEVFIQVRCEGLLPDDNGTVPPPGGRVFPDHILCNRAHIIDRIRKLYRLAEKTPFSNEALIARQKARYLCEQYGLHV